MEIRTVRKPGDKGTQALLQKFGEQLVCIRYRYDPVHKKRFKTIELIIAEQAWQPAACGAPRSDCGLFLKKKFANSAWCRELPNGSTRVLYVGTGY